MARSYVPASWPDVGKYAWRNEVIAPALPASRPACQKVNVDPTKNCERPRLSAAAGMGVSHRLRRRRGGRCR